MVDLDSEPVGAQPAALPPPRGVGAAGLARAFDAQVAACWRGETDGRALAAWLAARRVPRLPSPAGTPAAVSPHGAGGRGIAWHDGPGAVLGAVRGVGWGYRIPIGDAPPSPRDSKGGRP